MAKGPAGGPRPFASTEFENKLVFTNKVRAGGFIDVPKRIKEEIPLPAHDTVDLDAIAAPLENERFNSDKLRKISLRVSRDEAALVLKSSETGIRDGTRAIVGIKIPEARFLGV